MPCHAMPINAYHNGSLTNASTLSREGHWDKIIIDIGMQQQAEECLFSPVVVLPGVAQGRQSNTLL